MELGVGAGGHGRARIGGPWAVTRGLLSGPLRYVGPVGRRERRRGTAHVWRLFGGDKRDDNAKIFAAEKIVKYRAIFMALDVSPQNASAAVPAVQSDPKTKRGNSHQRRRQGRRERRQGQKSSPPRKIVIYRTIRMGLGPDASNARIAVPAVQSDRRSKRSAPSQRQRRGGDKTKNRRHRENREIFHDSHGSWYRHRQLECRGFSRAVRSKFQERRLAGAETSPKSPRSHFNWRFF